MAQVRIITKIIYKTNKQRRIASSLGGRGTNQSAICWYTCQLISPRIIVTCRSSPCAPGCVGICIRGTLSFISLRNRAFPHSDERRTTTTVRVNLYPVRHPLNLLHRNVRLFYFHGGGGGVTNSPVLFLAFMQPSHFVTIISILFYLHLHSSLWLRHSSTRRTKEEWKEVYKVYWSRL